MTVASELGRRLQLLHAAQWLSATHGDPYAQILLGHDEDPYPEYTAIRDTGSLVLSRDGIWVTARHRLAQDLLDHPSLGMRQADGPRPPEPVAPPEGTPLAAERVQLDRLAADVPLVGADVAERYATLADDACGRLLAGLGSKANLVTEVAEPLPAMVLADLCDLAGPERSRLATSSRWAGLAPDAVLCPQGLAETRRMLTAIDDLRDLFGAPRQIHGEAGVLLAMLGVRVATDLIAGAMRALLNRPRQWATLTADPQRATLAVSETLRYHPPAHLQSLVAHHDMEVAGVSITAGSHVVVLIGGANRDPDAFTEPDEFEVDRSPEQGPTLSPGYAYRLVAPFSRAVAEAALRGLADRFPRLRAAGPTLSRRRAPVTRGLLALPVVTGVDEKRPR